MKCKKLWTWLLFLMACSLAIPSEAQTTMDICPGGRKNARMVSPSGVPGLRAGTVANQPILYSFYTSVGGTPAIESDGKSKNKRYGIERKARNIMKTWNQKTDTAYRAMS